MTATIVNTDIISTEQRGMFQAAQNVCHGFGAICGASLGGLIADIFGWRSCFLFQLPLSLFAIATGILAINEATNLAPKNWSRLRDVDFFGSTALVGGLALQLVALTLGAESMQWASPHVLGMFAGSAFMLMSFVLIELRTTALPIVPAAVMKGRSRIMLILSNICLGFGAYSVRGPPLKLSSS